MNRIKPLAIAVSSVLLLFAHAADAQVGNPTATRSTTQVVKPPPPPPPPPPPRQLDAPRTSPPPAMPTQLGQRTQPPPVATPEPPQADDDAPARRIGAQPAKVYDRNGRVVDGMEQAGPNRVRDTRTGRYYNTVPAGDGQRIQPGQ